MKPHSYFANLNDDDLIEFSNDSLMKVANLRKSLKNFISGEIESYLKISLKNQAIKIYPATQIYYPDGTTKVHQNNWFGSGIACKLLKLGNKSWRQGKIKIRVEVEFCPDQKIDVNEIDLFDDIDIIDSFTIQSMVDEVDDELEQIRRQIDESIS